MSVLKRPSRLATMKELRTAEVLPKLVLGLPSLSAQRRGHGEPVVVLPGFGANDASTWLLRSYLRYLGWYPLGWGLGINRGNVQDLLPKLSNRIADVTGKFECKVRLVGWSLGGYLAREVGRDYPNLIERVTTLGSPVVGGPKYTAVASYYESQGIDLDEIESLVESRYANPLRIPVTAIFSKDDGVVAWEACIDHRSPNVEHIEVKGSHLSLGFSPEVLRIVANRL